MESHDKFESAADAVVTGDAGALKELLAADSGLVRARSQRLHRATLLHYLGANGVEDERQKTPRNAVQLAEILLDAGAEVDAVADIYGGSTVLGLVATSTHPRRAGVQSALLETLLNRGAAVDGIPGARPIVVAALHNGHGKVAEFLAARGARLDLEAAAGVGRLDVVKSFFGPDGELTPNATKEDLQLGFLWACEYGRKDVVEFLLSKGADLEDAQNTGLPPLHWAVVGRQTEVVQLLLARGASVETVNAYGGSALGQAHWSAKNGESETEYAPVIDILTHAGAR